MTEEEKEKDDPYVITGANLADDPYVIHGKNLIAEINVTDRSEVVSFLEREGVSVSGEHIAHAEVIRIDISGPVETVRHAIDKLLEQNPQITLNIQGSEAAGGSDAAAAR
jgi:hypothetical protein